MTEQEIEARCAQARIYKGVTWNTIKHKFEAWIIAKTSSGRLQAVTVGYSDSAKGAAKMRDQSLAARRVYDDPSIPEEMPEDWMQQYRIRREWQVIRDKPKEPENLPKRLEIPPAEKPAKPKPKPKRPEPIPVIAAILEEHPDRSALDTIKQTCGAVVVILEATKGYSPETIRRACGEILGQLDQRQS